MSGGVLTKFRVTGPGRYTHAAWRGYHGLRLADCALSGASGGAAPGTTLARTASGILFHDDFNRADGALGGNWVADQGTWAIASNLATNTSAGNFDRNRDTTISQADAVYECRMRAPTTSIYCGLRLLAPGAADDYHAFWQGNNGDKRLARAASTDTTIATLTMTANTSFHVVKVRYTATRNFVIWVDRVAALGSLAVPFTSGAGPTAAGNPGLLSYGGAAEYDWILVSSDHFITVTGLSGTQAFRLFDSGGGTVGSSAAQTAGSATLSLATLTDGLHTGYIEVHPDTSFGSAQARYPAVSGNATDICGGDSYSFS